MPADIEVRRYHVCMTPASRKHGYLAKPTSRQSTVDTCDSRSAMLIFFAATISTQVVGSENPKNTQDCTRVRESTCGRQHELTNSKNTALTDLSIDELIASLFARLYIRRFPIRFCASRSCRMSSGVFR